MKQKPFKRVLLAVSCIALSIAAPLLLSMAHTMMSEKLDQAMDMAYTITYQDEQDNTQTLENATYTIERRSAMVVAQANGEEYTLPLEKATIRAVDSQALNFRDAITTILTVLMGITLVAVTVLMNLSLLRHSIREDGLEKFTTFPAA